MVLNKIRYPIPIEFSNVETIAFDRLLIDNKPSIVIAPHLI